MNNETTLQTNIITADQILKHWQGHRALTRRVIEAFPEQELFNFSIGGMRSFATMIVELLAIAGPGAKGLATGEWVSFSEHIQHDNSKAKLLELWDEATEEINRYWPQINPKIFQEHFTCFQQYEGIGYGHVLYFIDNEIHHRGQGYVYLRALGIEPPFFWER